MKPRQLVPAWRTLLARKNIPSCRGFSLLEILVAVTILTIIVLLMAQIISATATTTRLSNRSIDAAAQARLAFDRIGIDLGSLVRRPDVPFSADPNGNLLFLSGVMVPSTATDNRSASVIAYQVKAHPDNSGRLCLLRGGKALNWTDTGCFGLDVNGLPIQAIPSGLSPDLNATSDFDVLAPGVIRWTVGFQLYPDDSQVKLLDGSVIANARGQIVYSPPMKSLTPTGGGAAVDYIDMARISSLVVGLVCVDMDTLRLIDGAPAQVATLAAAFPSPSAVNETPLKLWAPIAENPGSFDATIPLPVRQSVRVFQRFFPITPNGARDL